MIVVFSRIIILKKGKRMLNKGIRLSLLKEQVSQKVYRGKNVKKILWLLSLVLFLVLLVGCNSNIVVSPNITVEGEEIHTIGYVGSNAEPEVSAVSNIVILIASGSGMAIYILSHPLPLAIDIVT